MKPVDDAAALSGLVDPATLSRAREIVLGSLIRSRTKSANGRHLIGQVVGTDVRPYVTSVTVKRNAMGALIDFASTCSCPVGINCKHGVALVLCDDEQFDAGNARPALRVIPGGTAVVVDQVSGAGQSSEQGVGSQGWAATLEEFLDRPSVEPHSTSGEALGISFEIVTPTGARGTTPGIVLRPVRKGSGVKWVKGGITWSMIDHRPASAFSSARAAERNMVAKELLALSRLSAGNRYPSSAQIEVRLEHIASPRLWALLADAARAGLALISDAKGTPVTIEHKAALLTVDVTRRAHGLHVEPRVEIVGVPVDLVRSILIGNPAHGIAFWNEPAKNRSIVMTLAQLSAPVDDRLRSFLRTAVFDVPPADEKKFLATFLPELARKVAVASSDGTVDLPESRPPRVVLSIEPVGPHQLRLSWSRGVEGSSWREPLWATPLRDLDQLERDVLDEACEILISTPEMLERTPYGERVRGRSTLSGMAAAHFMERTVPELEGVDNLIIERTRVTANYKEATEAPVVVLEGTSGAQSDWLDLAVVVTVGGEYVSFAELFTALAAGQTTLILPSGTYFSLDTKELRALAALIAEARTLADPTKPGMRLSRYQASLFSELDTFAIAGADVARWKEAVKGLLDSSQIAPVEVPATLDATLRPYQIEGFRWLAHLFAHGLGGVLGDDMGLGKTLQALALICHARDVGERRPFLVVAPTSVVSNWASEADRFAPLLSKLVITETAARRGGPLRARIQGVDLVITSYALFRLDAGHYDDIEWAGAFFDEAQFVKNRTSKGYGAAKALSVPFKVTMSGTPIENNLMELWSLLSIGAPGLFPDPANFVEYYQKPIEKFANAERLSQLQRRMAPFLLRRTKEEVAADLPDKQEQVLEIELNVKHRRKYQTLLHRERQKVLGLLGDVAKHRFEIFRSLTLLRQASLDVTLVDPEATDVTSSKLDALLSMLDEIVADGHRVLVFSQFTRFLMKAKERLDAASIASCYLDGSTRHRGAVIEEFRSGGAPVFLISLKAGGFGLNLTEADYAILLDPWWNPATEAQAVDRIHRIGQTRKVMVYRLVAKDTVEEKVMALKATKSALFDSVLSDGTFASSSIDTQDLIDLFEE